MRLDTLALREAAEAFVKAKEKRRLADGGGSLERESRANLINAESALVAAAVKFTKLNGGVK